MSTNYLYLYILTNSYIYILTNYLFLELSWVRLDCMDCEICNPPPNPKALSYT